MLEATLPLASAVSVDPPQPPPPAAGLVGLPPQGPSECWPGLLQVPEGLLPPVHLDFRSPCSAADLAGYLRPFKGKMTTLGLMSLGGRLSKEAAQLVSEESALRRVSIGPCGYLGSVFEALRESAALRAGTLSTLVFRRTEPDHDMWLGDLFCATSAPAAIAVLERVQSIVVRFSTWLPQPQTREFGTVARALGEMIWRCPSSGAAGGGGGGAGATLVLAGHLSVRGFRRGEGGGREGGSGEVEALAELLAAAVAYAAAASASLAGERRAWQNGGSTYGSGAGARSSGWRTVCMQFTTPAAGRRRDGQSDAEDNAW